MLVQVEEPFPNEKRILVDSPKVPNYADKPEMSAHEVTEKVLEQIGKYDFIVQNFANPDLVGHSGELEPTIKALEVVDECIGKIVEKALEKGYHILLTADHGNAEYMIYEENSERCPSHTKNQVICVLISEKYKNRNMASNKGLKNIAPTVLEIMDIEKPL